MNEAPFGSPVFFVHWGFKGGKVCCVVKSQNYKHNPQCQSLPLLSMREIKKTRPNHKTMKISNIPIGAMCGCLLLLLLLSSLCFIVIIVIVVSVGIIASVIIVMVVTIILTVILIVIRVF